MTENKKPAGHPTPNQPGADAPLSKTSAPRKGKPDSGETLTDRQDDYSTKTAEAQKDGKSS